MTIAATVDGRVRPEFGLWEDGETVARARTVEISVIWNGCPLQVVHLDGMDAVGEYTIGEDIACDFQIPAEVLHGESRISLVRNEGDNPVFRVVRGTKVRIVGVDQTSGKWEEPETSEGWIPIPAGGHIEAEIGAVTFCVKIVAPVDAFRAPLALDWSPNYFVGLSLALHFVVLLVAYLIPPSATGLSFDEHAQRNRFFKYMLMPPQSEPVALAPLEKVEPGVAEGPGAKAHAGISGQAGDRRADSTKGRMGIRGDAHNTKMALLKENLKETAQTAGILGYLASANVPSSPFGSAVAVGRDPEDAIGALVGDVVGTHFGYGGLGVKGTGFGGGGDSRETVGVGVLDTIGVGGRGPGGRPYGRLAKKLGSRRARGPVLKSGTALVKGTISKEVIRRIVRRHSNEIKFCYEQGLQKRPDLAGRVSVKFMIDQNGVVRSAAVQSSSLDEPEVAQCIARAIRRITFPQPSDGGLVIVSYPFSLSSSES